MCLLPGVYSMTYQGIASVSNPADTDYILLYEVDIENTVEDQYKMEAFASGAIQKVSNGYSSYWPDRYFPGQLVLQVTDRPVDLQLRQSLSDKINVCGHWQLVYDTRLQDFMTKWYAYPHFLTAPVSCKRTFLGAGPQDKGLKYGYAMARNAVIF